MTQRFVFVVAGLTLLFAKPLYDLVQLALNVDLHSHTLLIPFVSIYFAWLLREELPKPTRPNHKLALAFGILGLVALAYYWFGPGFTAAEDSIATILLAYILFINAVALYLFGANVARAQSFSLAFLVFLLPMPIFVQYWANTFFQYTSAEVSYHMVRMADISIYRYHPLTFELPTIELHVAPSCSGIRSSLVLLITSIVAGKLFLTTRWKRWALILFIVPLAIVRNGFRIFTISYLCVHEGPHMVDHWIHHKGGPFFFALSLIPFFAFLWWLWRGEQASAKRQDLD